MSEADVVVRETDQLKEKDPKSGSSSFKMEEFGEHRQPSFLDRVIRPCLAEFVGVTLFVFVGCMAVQNGPDITAVALCHGFTIALMVAGFGHISGGHFNPAVTLGVCLGGGVGPLLAIGYVLSQVLGGVLGAACCRGVLRTQIVTAGLNMSVYESISAGGQTLSPGVDVGQGILCEMLLTSILVSTVLMTAVDDDGKSVIGPLMIGIAVAADILAGGKTTGASMNPARSFGPAVVFSSYNNSLWTYHYVYWIGPALGAILAAGWYRFMFSSSDKRFPRGCRNTNCQ